MGLPSSLARDISPPRPSKRRKTFGTTTFTTTTLADAKPKALAHAKSPHTTNDISSIEPTLAAIEAGKAKIVDHLTHFTSHLAKASRQTPHAPRLPIDNFTSLYQSNHHAHGHHFVIHQHNHPIAGVHYDLRLQFSSSSSLSFAIPKGLPGNPNSKSIGRMAIETRVHNYWNHLIESASSKTGSLLIWDTGTYSILPRTKRGSKSGMLSPQTTDDEGDDSGSGGEAVRGGGFGGREGEYETEKLVAAFQTRYIRLRLSGTRLPKGYTIILRLPSNEVVRRPTAKRKRSRKIHKSIAKDSDDEEEEEGLVPTDEQAEQDIDTDTDEDTTTRFTNAYPGSTNTIGSMHQRHWFLQLDRQNSGFVLDKSGNGKGRWVGGFEPFLVRGREYERSVVTGRLAREVESDEGVEGFVGRGGWTGVED
jgi:hypothetical protein